MDITIEEAVLQQMLEDFYTQGYQDGMQGYAFWKGGKEVVGISERPLKQAQADCRHEVYFSVPRWELKVQSTGDRYDH